MKALVAIAIKEETYTGDKRMCSNCCNYMIDAQSDKCKTDCHKCFEEGNKTVCPAFGMHLNYRNCNICGKHSIPSHSEEWKRTCTECFLTGNKGECRECETCHELNISTTEQAWVKLCKLCYSKSIALNRTCISCGKKNISPKTDIGNLLCTACTRTKSSSASLAGSSRKCGTCSSPIPEEWPVWRKNCIPCFKKTKN